MSASYKHQDCIHLILKELEKNPEFLSFTEAELCQYFSKIDTNCDWFKYYEDEKLAGFVAYYCNDVLTRKAFITLVLVDSKYRGLGIAKKMLTETLLEIKSKGFDECGLEVKPDNLNAISIYQTLGFESKEIEDNIIKMHKYM